MHVEAIDFLQQQAVTGPVDPSGTTALLRPNTMSVESMERHSLHRYRERYQFATSSIDSFISYTNERSKITDGAGVRTTVDIDRCSASAVFNCLTEDGSAGHGDDIARCVLKPNACYAWMLSLHEHDSPREQGTVFGQRELIDTIRDWHEHIDDAVALADKFQKVTTNSVSRRESEERDSARSMSAMEKIEAKANGGEVPRELFVEFEPYAGFDGRSALLSISCMFKSDEVYFRMKVRALPKLREAIANEFASRLGEALDEKPLLGTFAVA